jgi:hypothetical protein
MQLNDIQFTQLIADVEKEFGAYLAKAESPDVAASEVQVLSKSDEADKEPKKDEEKKDEPKQESKPEEKKDEESKPEQKEEQKEEEKSPEQKPEEKAPEGKEEGHGYDDEDMNHMHEMYGSMNKHELKAHHDSIKMALDKCMGMEKEEAAPMMPEQSAPQEMAKTEITLDLPIATPELELVKSELAAEKAKSDELKKSFETLTTLLSKLVKKTAPQGKAVTSVETIAKSESISTVETVLSDKQVTEILKRKASDPSLNKSDRELINAYYLSGTSRTTINHLLK